jgi:large subunit ribosomal protein L24
MKMSIKKEDTVIVLSGKDKGKTGRVMSVMPKSGKVVVEGVNVVTRATRPQQTQDGQMNEGGLVKKEAPIYACKVQRVCPKCGKATRAASKLVGDKKVRVCKKCGAEI